VPELSSQWELDQSLQWELDQSLQWFEEHYERTVKEWTETELYSLKPLTWMKLIEEEFIRLERESEGDAVCLIQPQGSEERVVRRIPVVEKQQGEACVFPNYIKHTERILTRWFAAGESGEQKIRAKLRKCAEGFADEVNTDVFKVLLEAAVVRQAPRRGELNQVIAGISDEINAHGFTADTLVIPAGARQRVVQFGIMGETYDIRKHQVGRTEGGLAVYWSDKLDEDSILIFDGRAVTLLCKEREIKTLTSQERGPLAIGVQVSQHLNVLVENCQSVRQVVGIRPLMGQPGGYGPRSIFIGYDFEHKHLFEELKILLVNNGYDITTGDPDQIGSISQAILDKIWNSQFFIGMMTKRDEKVDRTYTTSVWVLQEHATAIAYDKLAIILVEDGVSDYGAIQGDRQRLHFSRDNWSESIGELLGILKGESRGD
jgi:hypothetical protein